jgi:hypothetical protein
LSGPDLGITDRSVETLTLRVSEVDQDETAEFELTVSDGALSNATTVTMTFINVDQMPKSNAPGFATSQSELRFDGPIRLITASAYDDIYSILSALPRSSFLRVITTGSMGDELRAIFLPATGNDIIFSAATPISQSSGPGISDGLIERYYEGFSQSDGIGVTVDRTTNDFLIFGYGSNTAVDPFELNRVPVNGACNFIGEVAFRNIPIPSQRRRYFAGALENGGMSLWSTDFDFNSDKIRLTTLNELTPDLRMEGEFAADVNFCDKTIVTRIRRNNRQAIVVFNAAAATIRSYELDSNGSVSSIRLDELDALSIDFDFGDVPDLTFRDGYFTPRSLSASASPDFFDQGSFIGVWSDGRRDGEHRLVVTTGDGRVAVKRWTKGVPERVRLAQIAVTPPGTVTLPAAAIEPTFSFEALDIVIFTPDTPNLVVFRGNNYSYHVREFTFTGFSRTVLINLDMLPLSDVQFVDVGLGATDFASIFAPGSPTSSNLVLYRDQNKIRRFDNSP